MNKDDAAVRTQPSALQEREQATGAQTVEAGRSLRDKHKIKEGPVEILCKEIRFPFDRRLEKTDVLVMFVALLVNEVERMQHISFLLSKKGIGAGPSPEFYETLSRLKNVLVLTDRRALIDGAAAVHDYIHTIFCDEDENAEHSIDMLSSCVSAIRFGLELPCHSRHTASAGQHIWKQKYGIHLFDEHTSDWERDWLRTKFQETLAALITPFKSSDVLRKVPASDHPATSQNADASPSTEGARAAEE